MEVHHHSNTERKKWYHYFWEFLMLFLAVFCGFLAEYLLEHKIEKEKGKQYVRMMAEDLIKDTVILQSNTQSIDHIILRLDSAIKLIQSKKYTDKEEVKKLYGFYLLALPSIGRPLTDRTTVQLKNAGGMRLISKAIVADSIVDYWNETENLKRLELIFDEIRIKIKDQSYSIFDQRYYSDEQVNNISVVIGSPVLLTNDEKYLIEFANRLWHLRVALRNSYKRQMIRTKEKAGNLIALIRKEYNLK
jgi:hypothetical protein